MSPSPPALDETITVVSAYEIRTGVQVLLDSEWRFLAMKHVTEGGLVTLKTYTRGGAGGMVEHEMPHTRELETRIMYGPLKAPPKRAKRRKGSPR